MDRPRPRDTLVVHLITAQLMVDRQPSRVLLRDTATRLQTMLMALMRLLLDPLVINRRTPLMVEDIITSELEKEIFREFSWTCVLKQCQCLYVRRLLELGL